jgi:chromosome partitioning protein
VEYELAAAGADGQSVLAARFRKLKQGCSIWPAITTW